ncbi:MAG: acyl-CoA thioesterase, partial [Actinomycetota bacterium]|nr:acyl-CoA thioesterase [Actinomycetota bacterium]
MVNNASYLAYFEVGRVEWLRAAGLSYREMEDQGLGFVVVEARLFYKKAARFDDELTLRTELADVGRASLRFEYEVLRDGEVISTGYTRHGCIELASGRPKRVPVELAAK